MCGDNVQPVIDCLRVLGNNIAPDDAYLALRGMRTLSARLKRHEKNALKVAEWLAGQPEIERVLHPALPSCPGHELWQRDFTGSNGLFSVIFKPFEQSAMHGFIDGLELFSLGGSWGGYESLVLPSNVTRTATEWTENAQSIRFHIGLEDPDDLIEDIAAGLKRLVKG
ncbi:MAG: cystathionine beta-lyase, partial [Rhodospirillaceae bacterium]|nr:cystathionine beta-lyase [Rhodospirillaceae bacterium]